MSCLNLLKTGIGEKGSDGTDKLRLICDGVHNNAELCGKTIGRARICEVLNVPLEKFFKLAEEGRKEVG